MSAAPSDACVPPLRERLPEIELRAFADAEAVAWHAAAYIASTAREAIAARGRFTLAVSGGQTPRRMLRLLAKEVLPWEAVHVFQADERIVPAAHPERNLARIRESLTAPAQLHGMDVEAADPGAAAERYALEIASLAGMPAVLDLAHLGLGADGHTASLVPGDPVIEETQADVALTRPYQGHARMTLTFPILDRARRVLFIVTGAEKAPMLARLRARDATIPAGRVRAPCELIMADAPAAALGIVHAT